MGTKEEQRLEKPVGKPAKRAPTSGRDLAPIVAELQASGARSLRAIAAGLNERGIRTPRGKAQWQANTVAQLLARMPG
jgi:hypothetical protein